MQAGGRWPRKRPDRWQHPTTRHGIPDVFPRPEGGVHRCCTDRPSAAERLMEEALLRRFNPPLAAKIFVPRKKFPLIQDTELSEEPSGTEHQRQTPQVGVLSRASKST